MKKLFQLLKIFFTKGWSKEEFIMPAKSYWQYLLRYPHNYTWTLGSLLFIYLFAMGAVKYESPVLWTAMLFPVIMLVYNLVDEYYAFRYYKMPDYLKPLEGELRKDFSGTDAYWDRVNKFEAEHNIKITERHDGVIGRKISARTLQNIAKWLCGAVMVYIIIRVFVTG